jgi:hypothetical protein
VVFTPIAHPIFQPRIIEICFIFAVEINVILRTKFASKSPVLVALCYDYFNTVETSDWELNIRPQRLEY